MKVQYKRKRHTTVALLSGVKGHKSVKVGFLASKANQQDVDKAVYNNYGTSTTPPRPFFDNAMTDNKKKYINAMRVSAPKILRGETNVSTVTSKLGAMAQGDIQREITDLRTPPNSESTIKAKGTSNPLIDTGDMRRAVSWGYNESS